MNGPLDSATAKAATHQKRSVVTTQATTVLPFTATGGGSSPLARRCFHSCPAAQPKGINITAVNAATIRVAMKVGRPAISSGMRGNAPKKKTKKSHK